MLMVAPLLVLDAKLVLDVELVLDAEPMIEDEPVPEVNEAFEIELVLVEVRVEDVSTLVVEFLPG